MKKEKKEKKLDDVGKGIKHLLANRSASQKRVWAALADLPLDLATAARLVLADLAQMQADYAAAQKGGGILDLHKYYAARREAIDLYRKIVQTAAETDNTAPAEITVHHVGLYTTVPIDPETGLPIAPEPKQEPKLSNA